MIMSFRYTGFALQSFVIAAQVAPPSSEFAKKVPIVQKCVSAQLVQIMKLIQSDDSNAARKQINLNTWKGGFRLLPLVQV